MTQESEAQKDVKMASYIYFIIRRLYYTVQLYNKSQFQCQSLKKEMFFSEIEILGYIVNSGGSRFSSVYVKVVCVVCCVSNGIEFW